MINLILTIIILALIIYIIIVKETFEPSNSEECEYLPWGPDLKSCINYCDNPHKDMKDLYNECNTEDCIDLCKNCKDIDRCQWINPLVKDVNTPDTTFNPEIELYEVNDNNPSRYEEKNLYIDTKTHIEWEDPHNSKNYMIHYVAGTQMNNNVKVIFTNQNYIKFSKNENDTDSLYILKKENTYLFKVYGLNTDKPNTESNILPVPT